MKDPIKKIEFELDSDGTWNSTIHFESGYTITEAGLNPDGIIRITKKIKSYDGD